MLRPRFRAATLLLATFTLTACSGLRDALTAHVDLAARAGSQELSVTRLAHMITAANVPPSKEVATAITQLWVNYQLLGQVSAKGNPFSDPKQIDDAMWAQLASMKEQKFMEGLRATYPKPDTSTYEKRYNDGDVLAARHILFMAREGAASPAQRDSAHREAERVLKLVTPANFEQLAKKYSKDGSAAQGGDLGAFTRGMMVPPFEKGVLALKPGEVSKIIETQFGYHIIKRETWPDAKAKVWAKLDSTSTFAPESVFLANMEKNADVQVKPTAAKTIKAVVQDVDNYRQDRTVIASSRGGDLTAARLTMWMGAFPPQQRIKERIAEMPDSGITYFVKYLMRNELLLRAADSAKVVVDSQQIVGIRTSFSTAFLNAITTLQIAPGQLSDSAKTQGEKERLAAARVDAFLDKLLANKAQYVDVPEPVSIALRKQFDVRMVPAGIERAITEAAQLKAKSDSAKAKDLTPSVVPMPGSATPPTATAPGANGGAKVPSPNTGASPAPGATRKP